MMPPRQSPLHHTLEKLAGAIACFGAVALMMVLFLDPEGHWFNLFAAVIAAGGGLFCLHLARIHFCEYLADRKDYPDV